MRPRSVQHLAPLLVLTVLCILGMSLSTFSARFLTPTAEINHACEETPKSNANNNLALYMDVRKCITRTIGQLAARLMQLAAIAKSTSVMGVAGVVAVVLVTTRTWLVLGLPTHAQLCRLFPGFCRLQGG